MLGIAVILAFPGCDRATVLDARPDRDSCETCHRSLSDDGTEAGIETAHAGFALECADCHGGNPDIFDQPGAHGSAVVDEPAGKSAVELTQLPGSTLRFVNPADLRVAPVACGPCHADTVASVQRSLTATFAGALTRPRLLLGIPEGPVGVVDATDGAPALAPDAIPRIDAFPHPDTVGAGDSDLLDLYLRKACARCHAADFGTSRTTGDFRSSGCGACHVPYAAEGESASADSAGRPTPPAARTHAMVLIPDEEACARCHAGGARIAAAFRGNVPARSIGYLELAATGETEPHEPDVHALAGMTCTDCHAGGELHGTPSLYGSRHDAPSVRCSDCHGDTENRVEQRGGRFNTAGGWALPALSRSGGGALVVRTRSGAELPVPQLADLDVPAGAHGAQHARVACASCHSRYTINCLGCHVTLDESESEVDEGRMPSLIDGNWSLGGRVEEEGFAVDTSLFLLGEAPDGTVYPVVPAQAVLWTHVDSEGAVLREREVMIREGLPVFGLAAVEPHTVGAARACAECHIARDGSNEETVRRRIGAAPSAARITDGAGTEWDVAWLLDEDLEPRVATGSTRARPLGLERARLLLEEPIP